MIRGTDVCVLRPSYSRDAYGNEEVSWSREAVGDVLVAPASSEDASGPGRPHAASASVRFAFPKGYSSPLRGCLVEACGRTWSVVGDPRPNMAGNCPTRWWYTAEAVAADG